VAVDAESPPGAGSRMLVIEVAPGLPVGRHAVYVQGFVSDRDTRYVFSAPALARVTCKRTTEGRSGIVAGVASWRP
jgi:hypothetical protein